MSDFKIVKLIDPISLTLTGPNFQGEYASGTTYQTGMSVSYNGSSYVARQTTTGNVPTNTTYWQLLAAKGDTGAGAVAFTCRNSTGVPIQAFRVVYISGSTGNVPNITLAQGNNDPNSSKTFGVTSQVINNNSNGTVVHNGEIDNLDTSAFTAGNLLWLSPTTPGLVTTTRPPAPDHAVFVGYVVRAHPTQGKIIVTIQNGFELQELHNVLINGITNGQVIQYESATQLWKNHTLTKTDVGLGNVPNTDATNPANIVQTSSYRFVTDTEKSTWNGKQDALGFTPENVANKSTTTTLGTSDTLYPTQNAVKSYVDTTVNKFRAEFVFQPGGTAGGNVYTSWGVLHTQLVATAGNKIVFFDDRFSSPCVIPSGEYNFTNTTLSANIYNDVGAYVRVSSGVEFIGLGEVSNILMEFQTTSTVQSFSGENTINFRNCVIRSSGTSAPFEAEGASLIVNLQENAVFQNDGAPVFKQTSGADINFNVYSSSSIGSNTVSCISGSFISFNSIDPSAVVSQTQPGILGSVSYVNKSESSKVNYSPLTPANWPVSPDNIKDGLDTLAAIKINNEQSIINSLIFG
jgi:hypothetical protein